MATKKADKNSFGWISDLQSAPDDTLIMLCLKGGHHVEGLWDTEKHDWKFSEPDHPALNGDWYLVGWMSLVDYHEAKRLEQESAKRGDENRQLLLSISARLDALIEALARSNLIPQPTAPTENDPPAKGKQTSRKHMQERVDALVDQILVEEDARLQQELEGTVQRLDEQDQQILDRLRKGEAVRAIARDLKVSRHAVDKLKATLKPNKE